jgi:hypothetical protein
VPVAAFGSTFWARSSSLERMGEDMDSSQENAPEGPDAAGVG